MISAPGWPHEFQSRYANPGLCTCGRIRPHRVHQPRWWRIIHFRAKWR